MIDYLDIIKQIRDFRQDIHCGKYKDSELLHKKFIEINSLTGLRKNEDEYENLEYILKVQQFLIGKVCSIHKNEFSEKNQRLQSQTLDLNQIKDELEDARRADSVYMLNDDRYEYYIVGDIHSDTISLFKVLEKIDFFRSMEQNKSIRVVFLGDYVDRGKAHLKTLQTIMLLKYLFESNIFLLQGNHDDGELVNDEVKLKVRKRDYEDEYDYFLLYLYRQLVEKGLALDILQEYIRLFNGLCNIAFVEHCDKLVMLVHGGIPRPRHSEEEYYGYINTVSDFASKEIVDELGKIMKYNMLWSDPFDGSREYREKTGRFHFKEEHFNEFKNKVGFDILIRGHEAEKEGYKEFYGGSVFTIFSSGIINVDGSNSNDETVYDDVTPKIFHLKNKLYYMDIGC